MCQFSNIAKHITVYFLIVSFFMISFFGSYIKITSAQSGTTPVVTWTAADAAEYKVLKAKKDAGIATSDDEARIVELQKKSTASLKKPAPTTPAPTTPTVTWTDADAAEYKVLKAKKDAGIATSDDEARIVELQKKSLAAIAAAAKTDVIAAGTASGADKCKDTGSSYRWYAPTTWVSDSIATAICEMQVTIINWESSIIGWVIGKVLYPALGLCIEGGNPACPEPEMTTP